MEERTMRRASAPDFMKYTATQRWQYRFCQGHIFEIADIYMDVELSVEIEANGRIVRTRVA